MNHPECPYCGKPLPPKEATWAYVLVFVCLLQTLLVGVLTAVAVNNRPPAPAPATAPPQVVIPAPPSLPAQKMPKLDP